MMVGVCCFAGAGEGDNAGLPGRRYRRLRSSSSEGEGRRSGNFGGDAVVQATLHNCAKSFQTGMNVSAIQATLSEDNILSVATDRYLMQLREPDNTGALNTNLRIFLSRLSAEEFEKFLRILEESGRGCKPHEELHAELVAEYNRLKNNPDAAKRGAMDLLSDPQFIFREQRNLCECGWCVKQWNFCCCKIFIPVSMLLCIGVGLLFISGYFPLRHYADTPLAWIQPEPSQIAGTSDIIINMTSSNLLFSRSISIETNCSGSVYLKSHSDCQELQVTSTSTKPTPELHYLLNGSVVKIQYDTYKLNYFVIIKSFEGYSKYMELCHNISLHQECHASESKVVEYICSNESMDDNLKCYNYKSYNYEVQTIPINETDFYYFSIPMYPGPLYSNLGALSYDRSMYAEEGFSATNLTWDESIGRRRATVFLPGRWWWIHRPDNCMILSTDCPSKTMIFNVHYKLNFDSRFYNFLHIFVGSLFVILVLVVCIIQIACYVHRRGRGGSKEAVRTFSVQTSINVV